MDYIIGIIIATISMLVFSLSVSGIIVILFYGLPQSLTLILSKKVKSKVLIKQTTGLVFSILIFVLLNYLSFKFLNRYISWILTGEITAVIYTLFALSNQISLKHDLEDLISNSLLVDKNSVFTNSNKALEDFERKTVNENKWKKVEDIPDINVKSFQELQDKFRTSDIGIAVDDAVGRDFAFTSMLGKMSIFLNYLCQGNPFLLSILSVIAAIISKQPWFLLGIPVSFLGQWFGNPYNPNQRIFQSICGTVFIVFIYRLVNYDIFALGLMEFLMFSFSISFFSNEFIYTFNREKLTNLALDNENIFLYLFQSKALHIRNDPKVKI